MQLQQKSSGSSCPLSNRSRSRCSCPLSNRSSSSSSTCPLSNRSRSSCTRLSATPPRHQQQPQLVDLSRRAMLLAPPAIALSASAPAKASIPEIAAPGQWGLPFSLGPPPEPVKFPRKALNLRFAVLLMRSSFDAVHELAFIPMDKFEAKFWLLRQSEVEGYYLLYSPLKPRNGDLTDPLYFDFISFSQYSTISREMSKPLKVFNEYKEVCPPGAGEDDPCEAGTQLVQRPERFADDSKLPEFFVETTGDLIYQALLKGFQGETFNGPAPPKPGASIQQLAAGAQQLLDGMVAKGYAISATVSQVQPAGNGGSFQVTVNGPCNLWSLAALKARNSKIVNAYDVMAISAWLRAGGVTPASPPQVELGESGLTERWTFA